MRSLEALGREEFSLRVENGRRILREHGVSCFASGPDGERDLPWELDFLPFLIPPEEWRTLSAGLVQRARLLNLILTDLHSVQRLVRDGFLPPPLIFANPGYLRACQAVRVPGDNYLQLYAADVTRGTDGQWRVLADRTQTPAGLGFVLENRTVISRVLPEALHALRPTSLAETSRAYLDGLRRLAPQGAEIPAIALLTPGPRNETYFEHAYLARHLGFTLVEGADLTGRDCKVFLKTLEGMRQVNVIVRRVADAFCDPLALRGDSLLGVPGLVEATRAGNVSITNALGSGLLECPAILPFLPGLATHLLGEDLKLPSAKTWWCGQIRERLFVQEHLDELFLRPAFASPIPNARPGTLTQSAKEEWRIRLRESPHEFVGQEETKLARTQVTGGGSRSVVLRLFVMFDGQDFVAIPGGMARLLDDESLGTTSLPLAGGSQDVWVLPDGSQQTEQIHLTRVSAPALERLASDLPSRSAENLYWLGRYTERLEQLLRFCRSVVGALSTDAADGRVAALTEMLYRLGLAAETSHSKAESEALLDQVLVLLFDDHQSTGVRQVLKRIRHASFGVRDRLSADTWRILNRLDADVGERPGQLPLVFAGAVVNSLIFDLAAFCGMEMENMTRGHGWAFLDLGRRIERAVNLARMIEAALRSTKSRESLLATLLEIADSAMTYRRRYFVEPRLAGVLDLLLLDATNPRSLAFQLEVLGRHVDSLPSGPNPAGLANLQHQLALVVTDIGGLVIGEVEAPDCATEIAQWMAKLTAELAGISDLLTQVYFSQVIPRLS